MNDYYYPKKIVIEGDLVWGEWEKNYKEFSLDSVSQVIDYGNWYQIYFVLSRPLPPFVCQKSLITQGSIEEFETLFAEYPCGMSDEMVKNAVSDILAQHYDENNNCNVWKQCLHSIDLTTLNGDDTTEKVETMAQRVNEFEDHFPGVPNVAAMCVYPSLVQTAADTLTEPIGIAAVAAGFPASQTFIEVKIAEAAMAVAAGATEIDIVILKILIRRRVSYFIARV
jgi:hypothetical protein